MEEVDNIIIHSLKQVGCSIPNGTATLREFTVELVVQAVAKCLLAINENLDIPSSLPPSMSARFKIGSALAAACQDLGFPGDVGYQTFLYANEHDLRRVIMFLIEKLPKEVSDAVDEPLGKAVLMNRRIATELKRQLATPWLPAYCRKGNVHYFDARSWFLQGTSSFYSVKTCQLSYPRASGQIESKLSPEQKSFFQNLPFVTAQPIERKDFPASVIESNASRVAEAREVESEWNQAGVAAKMSFEDYRKEKRQRLMKRIQEKMAANSQRNSLPSNLDSTGLKDLLDSMAGREEKTGAKGSRFTHAEKLQFAKEEEEFAAAAANKSEQLSKPEDTEEEKQRRRDEEIGDLRRQLDELFARFQNVQLEIKQATAQKQQVVDELAALDLSNKELENAYRVKKRTMDLLPDAESNIVKLEELVESSSQRLVNLAAQWEKHRAPLVQEYRTLKEASKNRASEVESKIEQTRLLRSKMKVIADETREKEELLKQLATEFENMSQDVNRSAYTRRILEIVSNIKKQKEEIAKVLQDTRSLQKDINFLSGKLDRTFAVTDELVFRDAKKDEFSRKAYKLLASLHEGFSTLVQTVEETGSVLREIRDIEEQIDNINEGEVNSNLERIDKDLKQVKQENADMIAVLKGRR